MPKATKKQQKQQQQQTARSSRAGDVQAIIRGVQDGLRIKEKKKPAPNFLDSVNDAIRTYGPVVSGLAKIVGMGDYTVEANTVSTSGTASQSVPSFPAMKGNRIRHKECLGVITAPGDANFAILKRIAMNPGNPSAFPWLASFAGNFTGYKVHGAAYVFESNTSEYSAVPYMGTLCIGTRYDTREPDFTSMVEMQNCKFSVSAKPSQNIIHPIECKEGFQPFDNWLIRRGNESNVVYGYDKCNVYVAAEGLQSSTSVLGRLWITYDIELINPVTPVAPTTNTQFKTVMADTGGNTTFPTVVTAATSPLVTLFNNFTSNTAYNADGGGLFGTDLAKSTDILAAAPYAALYADGKLRVYKSCTVFLNWKVVGSGMNVSTFTFSALSFPADGSEVLIRRTQGTNNSAGFIGEGDAVVCTLLNPAYQGLPPATNSYFIELAIENLGGTISSTSAQLFVCF